MFESDSYNTNDSNNTTKRGKKESEIPTPIKDL